jgi:hypothetical protein
MSKGCGGVIDAAVCLLLFVGGRVAVLRFPCLRLLMCRLVSKLQILLMTSSPYKDFHFNDL